MMIIPRLTFALLAAAMALPAFAASPATDTGRPAVIGIAGADSPGATFIDSVPGIALPAPYVSPVVRRYRYYYPRYSRYRYYYPYRYYSYPSYYRQYYSWPYYNSYRYRTYGNRGYAGVRFGGRRRGLSFGIHF